MVVVYTTSDWNDNVTGKKQLTGYKEFLLQISTINSKLKNGQRTCNQMTNKPIKKMFYLTSDRGNTRYGKHEALPSSSSH